MPHFFHALTLNADPAAVHLPLTFLLVFGVAKLLAEIFERLGQPGIVGEILAGVLLGPSVLNWVRPDQMLSVLGEMGVMFLLFRVGLKVKASELMTVGGRALAVAAMGVVLPFLAGWVIMTLAGAARIEAIFVAAAMVATSVGITAQVLAAKGLLRERASQIILAAAVIDDVLGLLVLAVVSSLAEASVNIWGLVTTAVLATVFILLVARFGTPTTQRIVPWLERRPNTAAPGQTDHGTLGETQFNVALVLLFGLSLLAVYTGLAAIIGAFLAGMALSETVNNRVQDLAQGITELLVPFFLVGLGLRLDIGAFSTWHTLSLTAIILLAAVLSKLIGCGLGAWSLGRADALRIGVGMIPRGEVGMVVAQIGLRLGFIENSVYAVVVAMAVLTTLVAPPLLKYAYRNCVPCPETEDFTLA